MITYTRVQIETAHAALNSEPESARHDRLNHILATMLVHDQSSIDVNALAEGDSALIESLLATTGEQP